MGVAGGVVPTPSALVVLLGANAVGRMWFGVLLVAMYGIGMAVTLTGAGYVFVRLERRFEKMLFSRPWWGAFLRYAPLATALVLTVSGAFIAASAF
jgi:ABC-type nickel/cobalt efflux system permease component RcnA